MNRRASLALAAGGLIGGLSLSLALPAAAQTYPAKPIRIVVPYVAGGGTDTIARAMGEKLSKRLGQPVVVDNKAGASGIIGTDAVAKAAPDGYTLLMTLTQSVLTNQFLYQKLPYDPRKDLTMISVLADAQLVLVAHPSVPARTVRELGDYARSRPGKLSYASWGVGSLSHLSGAYYSKLVHGQAAHVPYKGEAPMMQDLIGGQIDWGIGTTGTLAPHLKSGRLRALAVMGNQKLAELPDVPTMAEAGFPGAEYRTIGWGGILAPANVPAPVLAKLEQAARAAAQTTAMKARFQVFGMQPLGTTGADFKRDVEATAPVVERLVRLSGARVE